MSIISTYLGSGGGASGGGGEQITGTSEYCLTSDNQTSLSVCFSQAGSIYLPDATTLEPGSPSYTIKNIGSTTALLYDYGGNLYNYINPFESIDIALYNNACQNGGWTFSKPTQNQASIAIESGLSCIDNNGISTLNNFCVARNCQNDITYITGWVNDCVYSAVGKYNTSACEFQLTQLTKCQMCATPTAQHANGNLRSAGRYMLFNNGVLANVTDTGTVSLCCLPSNICASAMGENGYGLLGTDFYNTLYTIHPICNTTCIRYDAIHMKVDGTTCIGHTTCRNTVCAYPHGVVLGKCNNEYHEHYGGSTQCNIIHNSFHFGWGCNCAFQQGFLTTAYGPCCFCIVDQSYHVMAPRTDCHIADDYSAVLLHCCISPNIVRCYNDGGAASCFPPNMTLKPLCVAGSPTGGYTLCGFSGIAMPTACARHFFWDHHYIHQKCCTCFQTCPSSNTTLMVRTDPTNNTWAYCKLFGGFGCTRVDCYSECPCNCINEAEGGLFLKGRLKFFNSYWAAYQCQQGRCTSYCLSERLRNDPQCTNQNYPQIFYMNFSSLTFNPCRTFVHDNSTSSCYTCNEVNGACAVYCFLQSFPHACTQATAYNIGDTRTFCKEHVFPTDFNSTAYTTCAKYKSTSFSTGDTSSCLCVVNATVNCQCQNLYINCFKANSSGSFGSWGNIQITHLENDAYNTGNVGTEIGCLSYFNVYCDGYIDMIAGTSAAATCYTRFCINSGSCGTTDLCSQTLGFQWNGGIIPLNPRGNIGITCGGGCKELYVLPVEANGAICASQITKTSLDNSFCTEKWMTRKAETTKVSGACVNTFTNPTISFGEFDSDTCTFSFGPTFNLNSDPITVTNLVTCSKNGGGTLSTCKSNLCIAALKFSTACR